MGTGCLNELPGMGGVNDNENFRLNCSAWSRLYEEDKVKIPQLSKEEILSMVRNAPVTGAEENIGWRSEEDFYYDYFVAIDKAGIKLTIGDGTPDKKLLYGIKAVKEIRNEVNKNARAAVFLKPYPDENLYNRFAWATSVADYIGVDIDSYNILTMRNKVKLEKKSPYQIQQYMKKMLVPFVVKGVFTREDVEMVKEAKPDVIYISNHGGRVETRRGSTALMLKETGQILKKYCNELWVDGGIRCKRDIELAHYYGASQVLIGRPFIKNFCYNGFIGIDDFLWSPNEL